MNEQNICDKEENKIQLKGEEKQVFVKIVAGKVYSIASQGKNVGTRCLRCNKGKGKIPYTTRALGKCLLKRTLILDYRP